MVNNPVLRCQRLLWFIPNLFFLVVGVRLLIIQDFKKPDILLALSVILTIVCFLITVVNGIRLWNGRNRVLVYILGEDLKCVMEVPKLPFSGDKFTIRKYWIVPIDGQKPAIIPGKSYIFDQETGIERTDYGDLYKYTITPEKGKEEE